MRTSNKMLIGFGAFILLLTLIGLIAGRLVIDYIADKEPDIMITNQGSSSGFESVTVLEEVDKIDTLKIYGRWNMKINKGKPQLEMKSYHDESILKEFSVRENVILLSSDEDANAGIDAVLTLPDPGKLRKINDWGLGTLHLSDCEGDTITVDIKGELDVNLFNCSWDLFELDGMGSIGLSGATSEIEKLDVNLAGVIDADVVIRDGGTLEGEVAGTGSVEYSGDNVKEDFSFLGPGKIKHK